MALLGLIDLMVDAEEIMLFKRLLPPDPRLAVQGPVGVGVQIFDAAPVGDEVEFHGAALVLAGPGGLAEDWIYCQLYEGRIYSTKERGHIQPFGPFSFSNSAFMSDIYLNIFKNSGAKAPNG